MTHHRRARGRRATALSLTLALAAGTMVGALAAAPAEAAAPPVVQRDATNGVTADLLPTTQINASGWVEDQAIKGDTVFAGGKFSSARPAGAAEGTSESARTNLLAYSLSTGVLNTGFKPTLNNAVHVLALSPDNTRLYVGGEFTTVNGSSRSYIVAFDTSNGQVVTTFKASLNGPVRALAVTSSTVYVGGSFSQANGNNRAGLAAFRTSDGGLLSGWTPSIDRSTSTVNALVVAPGGRVVAGGSFLNVKAGSTTYAANGSASLDPSTGTPGTWKVNSVVRQGGAGASTLSLHTDGTNVYGTGYRYGTGTANYEGVWAAKPTDGSIAWLADCHGDTYDATVLSGVVYTATHQHDCSNIGGFPEQAPSRIERRATAFTSTAKGTVLPNSLIPATYSSFPGQPAPSLVNWFPDFKNPTCTTTGCSLYASQPTNTIESSGSYVVVGGQFPSVNGVAQQGLARFGKPSVAPKKDGPRTYNGTGPTVRAISGNAMRITAAPGDRDNYTLSRVELWRTDKTSPIWSADNVTSPWWRTTVAYTDTGLKAGTTYVYYLKMTDPDGNTTTSGQGYAKTAASGTVGSTTYSSQVRADGAVNYWRLDDAAGSTKATDWAGKEDLTLRAGSSTGVSTGAAGVDGSDGAATFSGGTNAHAYNVQANRAPQTFTVEAWFRSSSATGGLVVGYGNKFVDKSEYRDRQVYLTSAGKLAFYVNSGGAKTVTSAKAYNDGQWHQAVASLSSGGMALYVDGAQVASNTAVTSAQDYAGFWRLGGDAVPGDGSVWLNGSIDEVSTYAKALTPAQVADHYTDVKGTAPTAAPAARFASACTGLSCSYDATTSTAEARLDAKPNITSFAWALGDGSKAAGSRVRYTYKKASKYDVTLTVTNSEGMAASATRRVSATGNSLPVAAFTSTVKGKKVTVDAKRSSDSDGTVRSYRWTFGDGSTSTKKKVSHTYYGTGVQPVRLTVTDNRGGTGTANRDVVVGKALGRDAFSRSVASGWGKANKGGTWKVTPRGAAKVAGGKGTLTLGAKGTAVATLAKKGTKANVVSDVRIDRSQTGASATTAYVLRSKGSSAYRAKLVVGAGGRVQLVTTRVVGGKEKVVKTVAVAKVTAAPSTTLRFRATISGGKKATVRLTVWRAGTKEPKAQSSVKDGTKSLRRSGAVGVWATTAAPASFGYDDLLVTSS